ncbi:MAG: glucose-1-phosphate adenylyltransferase [Pyrinomonadaceae bacterium]|nr:glucose-1-phosphate adenylyltransferase [Pyrinomonadaceae bacterium]
MAQYDNVVAVILGGGAGSRLFPLTQERSKPAVPLGGKYRLIDVPVSNCINSGISQIFVLTQYNSASLNRHISQTYRFSSFSTGFVEILAAEQRKDSPDWFQGTADAVRQILPHLRDWRIGKLLILSGDHLYRMNYEKFLNRHESTNADVTISVIPSRPDEAESFGLLKTDSIGKVLEFKEKPKGEALESMRVDTTKFGLTSEESERRPYLASMGIYVFDYQKLIELLAADETAVDFGGEIIPAAISKYNVQAHLFDGYWEDIGTIKAFYEANLDLASPLPKFNFFDASAPIYTRSRYLPPSKLHECDIDNSLVCEGCILNGIKVRNSVIGLRSRIDAGTLIEDSIVMGSDFFETIGAIKGDLESGKPHVGIGANCVIKRAILDKNVRIGKNVKLINKDRVENFDAADGSYYIRDGLIIVPKNGTIADGTEV